MTTITMIKPDGAIIEIRVFVERAPAVFAWIGAHIDAACPIESGEAVLIAKTEEGWRVHGPIDYKNLIDRLETVSKE